MYNSILVAYNGTPESRAALYECIKLAPPADTAIHLLVVVNLSTYLMGGDFVAESAIVAERERMSEELEQGKRILEQGGLNVTTWLEAGEPTSVITRMVDEVAAECLILAHSRKKGAAARWWKGAKDSFLVEHINCSVLVASSTSDEDAATSTDSPAFAVNPDKRRAPSASVEHAKVPNVTLAELENEAEDLTLFDAKRWPPVN